MKKALNSILMNKIMMQKLMTTAKKEVESLLKKLPDSCSLEDIQYHLYVVQKIRRWLDTANSDGVLSQDEVEKRLLDKMNSLCAR